MTPSVTSAGLLDTREIALIMESTLVDFDVNMIALHHGPDLNSPLNYVSRIDPDGWAGRLWGVYGGRDVDIYYTGSLVPVPGDPNARVDISYTSQWYFDGDTGSGSGTAVYTDPEFSFGVDLLNMEVSGAVSVTYGVATLTLSGSKNFTTHKLAVTGSASAFDLPLVGSLADASLSFEFDQQTGEYSSTAEAQVLGGWLWKDSRNINRGRIYQPPPPPDPPPPLVVYPPPPSPRPAAPPFVSPGDHGGTGFDESISDEPGYNYMETETIPEPATLTLLAFGAVAVWRKRAS